MTLQAMLSTHKAVDATYSAAATTSHTAAGDHKHNQ